MFKIKWSEDDTIEEIIKNNRLDVQHTMDIFKANNYDKPKTISQIEQEVEEAHKKWEEYKKSPEHKKTMESMGQLLGFAGLIGSMNPYLDDTIKEARHLTKKMLKQ